MTTEPSGEAEATSDPPHGPPAASLGNEANNRSGDSATGESQGQVPLPADVSAESPAASSEPQDIGQAPSKMATKEAESTSGDKDQSEAAPGNSQERQEEVTALVRQDPGTLQVFVGPQSPELDTGARRITQGHVTFLDDSQDHEHKPQKASVSKKQLGSARSRPNAESPPSAGAASPPPARAEKRDPQPPITIIITEAPEEPAGEEELVEGCRNLQAGSFPPSPAGSAPASPSPGPHAEAPGRRLLDSDLYTADEDHDYRRSMTSLLGGGEGSISSLADVLVWSDTTMGMGVAVGCLASGRSSPTVLLRSAGPSLRSVSSILGSASSAFSSGLAAGTGVALRSVTHALESVERRTVEGVRSAVRYLTSRLPPRRAHAGQTD